MFYYSNEKIGHIGIRVCYYTVVNHLTIQSNPHGPKPVYKIRLDYRSKYGLQIGVLY